MTYNNKYIVVTGNHQNIIYETPKAYLVKRQHDDWQFWLPRSLVRDLGGWKFQISVPVDFVIQAFRTGKGKHNRATKIAEREVKAKGFEKWFLNKQAGDE